MNALATLRSDAQGRFSVDNIFMKVISFLKRRVLSLMRSFQTMVALLLDSYGKFTKASQ